MQKTLIINWFNLESCERKEKAITVDRDLVINENLLIDLISNFCGMEKHNIKIEGHYFII
ncbi:hypothetical protein [Terrisporobacter sp.]|uniref:hypothetical protein n=1 Tax=Terrisporobacter sp. TaxID=1965305 RepID=UPI00261B15BA|nr:hypothetical protein [Terrisporobacter sp.]